VQPGAFEPQSSATRETSREGWARDSGQERVGPTKRWRERRSAVGGDNSSGGGSGAQDWRLRTGAGEGGASDWGYKAAKEQSNRFTWDDS
jgi:hypothetical protein